MVTKLSTIFYLLALTDATEHHRKFRRSHRHHFRESAGVQLREQGFTHGLFEQIAMAYTADERIVEEREEESKARSI